MKSNKMRRILNFNRSKFNRHYTHALFSGSTKTNYYGIINICGGKFRGLLKFNWVMGTHFRIRELFYPTNRNMTLYPQFIKLWRMFNLVGNVPKKCNDFSV